MKFNRSDNALVGIDPQDDALSETGVSRRPVGASIKENDTVENLERFFRAANDGGVGVLFLSRAPANRSTTIPRSPKRG